MEETRKKKCQNPGTMQGAGQAAKKKTCQNCKQGFVIEKEDFKFYKKIDVPEPTFCPECRMQKRASFFNQTKLYKRKCDGTGKDIFSVISADYPGKVYDTPYWWSDNWEAIEYGRDYDFSKPFFEQIKELDFKVPKFSRSVVNLVNSDHCAGASDLKNCYLLFNSGNNESCSYGVNINDSLESVNNYNLVKGELCGGCFMAQNCYKVFYSFYCNNCQEIYFSKNLKNCNNCFGCVNLRHKKYHIFNKPYSKKEYLEKLKEFNIGSYKNKEKYSKKLKEFSLSFPHKFRTGLKNKNVSGEYINNSKNVKNSFLINKAEDCKYCLGVHLNAKNCYDYTLFGENVELVYETVISGLNSSNLKFCYESYLSDSDLEYCIHCMSSSNLFACVGLRHKQYCILNQQYTKEEYEELVPKIKQHMNDMPYTDKKGNTYKYGEFFPPEMSPFAYNETIANEYFPLTKEEAKKQGYAWYDKPKSEYQPTIKAKDLPDHIKDVKEDILEEVIECTNETKDKCQGSGAFKIIPAELKFYQKQGLPLPRFCPDCRHHERIKQRNPMKLHKRQCMCGGERDVTKTYKNQQAHSHKNQPCINKFQTTYAPDREEIVYCEKCYQKEVE